MVAIEHFDCILIDYHLGCTDGVALAGQMKARHGEATPMVMLTGEPSPALAEQALRSGLTDFISKRSLTGEQLRQTLCNAMVKRRMTGRPGAETDEGGASPASADMRQAVTEALSLLDQSLAMQRCLAEDREADMAIAMLRQAVAIPQHTH